MLSRNEPWCSSGCALGAEPNAAEMQGDAPGCDVGAATHGPGGPIAVACALQGLSVGEMLRLLPNLEAEVAASHDRLRVCVAALRARRATWREIGQALAVSRQAAWERFHAAATDPRPGRAS